MSHRRRWMRWSLGIVAALGGACVATAFLLHEPRPSGLRGAEADALARRLAEAANVSAWERTRQVRWTFAGTHHHRWDRRRGVAEVRWDDVRAVVQLADRTGRAWEEGREVDGERARELVEQAYARWVNDSFWLNPLSKLFDDGAVRELVELEDGTEALLVTYTQGGLTPGDAYLWIPGPGGLPRAWRMWVSVIPIGGLEVSWERWITLSTGAKVSTLHRGQLLPLTVELTDVAAE